MEFNITIIECDFTMLVFYFGDEERLKKKISRRIKNLQFIVVKTVIQWEGNVIIKQKRSISHQRKQFLKNQSHLK